MNDDQRINVHDALLAFWTDKDEQITRQRESGRLDAGMRGAATGGGHLNRIAEVIARECCDSGVDERLIWYRRTKSGGKNPAGTDKRLTLPGFYRPSKSWDLVIYNTADEPVAALEFKSQAGSFGNNANNRVEEAIGNSVDLNDAIDAGVIKTPIWTGFAFVIEDCAQSHKTSAGREPSLLQSDPIFTHWTYMDRVRIACQRLVERGRYNSTWAVATRRPPEFDWHELDSDVSGYAQFMRGLLEHLKDTGAFTS